MPELDIGKVLDEQERILVNAENEYNTAIRRALSETIAKIDELRKGIKNDITTPLENSYAVDRDALTAGLLSDIAAIIAKYNISIYSAGSQFIIGYGRAEYDRSFKPFFDVMTLRYMPQSGMLVNEKKYTMSGLTPDAAKALTATASLLLGVSVWTVIAGELMNVPLIRDIVIRIINILYSAWNDLYFSINPARRRQRNNLEQRAKYLQKVSKMSENAFNIIITAIQTLQNNLSSKINAYMSKQNVKSDIQAIESSQAARKVYVPYTVLPVPLQRNISPAGGGQGASLEYKREYIPADNVTFNDYTDGTGRFDIKQYAMRIYIPKERFVYGK